MCVPSLHSLVNECSDGTHNCSQLCINTIGSFTCKCDDGYELDFDDVTCNGMYKMFIYLQLYIICLMINVIEHCLELVVSQSGLYEYYHIGDAFDVFINYITNYNYNHNNHYKHSNIHVYNST